MEWGLGKDIIWLEIVSAVSVNERELSIGSTTSTWRLCDLSSAGKFGRGEPPSRRSQERMSRRRRQRSVELPMPALGRVVLPHTSKIKPYTARGHYVRSCKDLCETQLSRCEIQIGLCAAIVVLELADLRGTAKAKVFHIRYKPKGVR